MALEALLPSEVARLVYGYLIDEKCIESAKTFLNESLNLVECRSVLMHGRHFSTRVCGYSLTDILDKFCVINSIVQDKIDKSDNLSQLKNKNVVNQIKFFVEEYKGQQLHVDVDVSSQNSSTIFQNESPSKFRRKLSSPGKDENTRHMLQLSKERLQIEKQLNFNQHQINSTTETTPVKSLSAHSINVNNKKCDADKLNPRKSSEIIHMNNISREKLPENSINLQNVQNVDNNVSKQCYTEPNKNIVISAREKKTIELVSSEVQTSEITPRNTSYKDVTTDTTLEKLQSYVNTEVQTSDIGSPDSESPNDCVELLSNVTSELLNRTEIQEKIANNINEVLEPIKSNFQEKSWEVAEAETNKSFILEYNKAIAKVVDKTENDPEILDMIESIIAPHEELISTEDEIDMDVEINSEEVQENAIATLNEKIFENNVNKYTESSKVNYNECQPIEGIGNNQLITTENRNDIAEIHMQHNNLLDALNPCTTSTIPTSTHVFQENSKTPIDSVQNISSATKDFLNSLELPNVQQKTVATSDTFYNQNNTLTSTPLKNFMGVNNFDWFSTDDLPSPNIGFHKEDTIGLSKLNNPYIYTSCETVVTTTTTFLSPIKEKYTVAEKITLSCSFTNMVKDQTLHTPDFPCPAKSLTSNINTTTIVPVTNSLKNKTPLSKNSEANNSLVNPPLSIQKSNGNVVDSLSPLLKDISDYNKYFNVDTMMLHGVDNTTSSMHMPLTMPEIEVDDPITLTGINLSPFLKIQKKSDSSSNAQSSVSKNNEQVITKEKPKELDVIIEKNIGEMSGNASISVSNIETITKSTPKTLLASRLQHNRLSLSTPKKPSSHVRALNFDTPPGKSQSDGKRKDREGQLQSPESLRRSFKGSACKSSLFRSPPFSYEDTTAVAAPVVVVVEQNPPGVSQETDVVKQIPDPEEKQKNLGIEETENLNQNNENILKNKDSNNGFLKKNNSRNSWDSDLRKFLGIQEVEKKDSGRPKRKYVWKNKKSEKIDKDDKSKNDIKDNGVKSKKSKQDDKLSPRKSKDSEKCSLKKSKKKDKSPEKSRKSEKKSKEKSKEPSKESPKRNSKSEKLSNINNKSKETLKESSKKETLRNEKSKETSKEPLDKSDKFEKTDTNDRKKDEEIKTQIESKVAENKNNTEKMKDPLEIMLSDSIVENEINDENDVIKLASEEVKNFNSFSSDEIVKNCGKVNENIIEKMQVDEKNMSAMFMDTEKNLTNQCTAKTDLQAKEEKEKPTAEIKSSISVDYVKLEEQLSLITDETPKPVVSTPNTTTSNSTPKSTESLYEEVSKVECGRLVQKKYARLTTLDTNISKPTDEKRMPLMGSFVVDLDTPCAENTVVLAKPVTPCILSPGSSVSLLAVPAVSKLSEDSRTLVSLIATPLECPLTPTITLTPPKVENSTDPLQQQKNKVASHQPTLTAFEKKSDVAQFEVIKENLPKENKSEVDKKIDNEEIKNTSIKGQESETLKNSSHDSSMSSSSTCSSCCSSSSTDDDSSDKEDAPETVEEDKKEEQEMNIITNQAENEVSPTKLMPILKTDQELADTIKETPARDENAEVEIHDTPNISKPIDNPTNLNAKFSQIMIQKECEEMEKLEQNKAKPRIINVERVMPKVITKPVSPFLKALPLNIQNIAMEVKKKFAMAKKITMEKTEQEIASAVDSIKPVEESKSSPQSLNRSIESTSSDPDDTKNSSSGKLELITAIESITKCNEAVNSATRVVHADENSNCSSNIELVLEDEDATPSDKHSLVESRESSLVETSKHEHNTRFKSRQKLTTSYSEQTESLSSQQSANPVDANGFSNSDAKCQEIRYIFDEESYKRRRRKPFTAEDLQAFLCVDDEMYQIYSTKLEFLLEVKPKRTWTRRNPNSVAAKGEDENSMQGLSTSNAGNDNKETNKRKRESSSSNIKKRKTSKNAFILN